jgi:hypothetical protein
VVQVANLFGMVIGSVLTDVENEQKTYMSKRPKNSKNTLLKGFLKKGGIKIRRNDVKCCENKIAKIVLDNDFVIRGKIDKVSEDSIFFSTAEKTAIIRLDSIKQIIF